MKKKILIEGMSCKNCVAHVTEALEELNDATGIEVNLEGKYAVVINSTIDDLNLNKIDVDRIFASQEEIERDNSKLVVKAIRDKGGCGECQTSCQSACKTSCTVANQECER